MAYRKQGALVERVNTTNTSGATLTLVASSASYQRFTGTTTHIVVLPVGTTIPIGGKFAVLNRSTGIVTVNYNGGSLAATVNGDSQTIFRCTDNSTAAGAWDATVESSGGGSVTLTSLEKLGALSALAGSFYQDSQTDAVTLQINPEEIGGNFWTTKTPLSSVRRYTGSFTLGGFIYSLGGENPVSTKVTTVERYNDDSNAVLARTALTTATTQVGGFALTLGYASGGFQASQTAVVQAYDDVLDSWSAKAALPATRASYTPAVLDGYGILSGGDLSGSPTATSLIYDSVANVWYSRADRPISRRETLGFASPNKYYSIGGETAATNLGYAFSSVSNSWVSIANHPATTIQNGPATFASGTGYSMGGQGPAYSAVNYRYNVDANLWNTMSPKPTGAHSNLTSGASLNGVAYVLGGETTGVTLISSIESYTPFSFLAVPLSKKSTSAPTSIFVAAALSGVVTSVPVRIRTDGTNWKNLTANADSVLKQGETFAKFAANGSGYYNYELQIGLPTYLAATGGGQWVTKANLSFVSQHSCSFTVGTQVYGAYGLDVGGRHKKTQRFDTLLNASVRETDGNLSEAYTGGLTSSSTLYGRGFTNGHNGAVLLDGGTMLYDTILKAWTTVATGGGSGQLNGNLVLNGFAYSASGGPTVPAHQLSTYRYTLSTNSWSSNIATLNNIHYGGMMSALNGFGYMVGGTSTINERFNDASGSWLTMAATAANVESASSFVIEDGWHIAAPYSGGNSTIHYLFKDGINAWISKTAYPISAYGPVGGSVGNSGYSMGGNNGAYLSNVYQWASAIQNVVLGAALRIS